MKFLRQLLAFTGIEAERLRCKWVSSAEGAEFATEMRDFVEKLRHLGPSPLRGGVRVRGAHDMAAGCEAVRE